MKIRGAYIAALTAALTGLLIMKWQWLVMMIDIRAEIARSGSLVTFEYFISLPAAFILGVIFPKFPTHCGVWLMLGPVLITHSVFIAQHGVPSLWPAELVLLAILALPYIGLAHIGATVGRRIFGWTK